jgi:pilus assembly protein TadC
MTRIFAETGLGEGATVLYAVTGSAFILQVILFLILALNFYTKIPIVQVNKKKISLRLPVHYWRG